MSTIPSASARLGYVDQMRGTAILMVIAVHQAILMVNMPLSLTCILKSGQLGVELFFVVSALTLCISHEKRRQESYAYLKYLVRRFFRIAPLYYVGVALFALMYPIRAKYGVSGTASPYTTHNILANVFFIHGFVPSANNSVLPGGWSIGTEVAFYLIFPSLFVGLSWIHGRLGLMGTVAICALLCASSIGTDFLLLRVYGTDFSNNSFAYFILLNQFSVFIAGILLHFFCGAYVVLLTLNVVISYAIAIAAHLLIEEPGIKQGRKLISRINACAQPPELKRGMCA